MDPILNLIPTSPEIESVLLLRTPITIGRHPENVVQLMGENVSRFHAVIEFVVAADGIARHRVRDLGSINGVRLNGVRVSESFLSPGDRLGVGSHEYILRSS